MQTREEIAKLVSSAEYKQAMKNKGVEVEGWNWKLKETKDGVLQPDEDTLDKKPINLCQELNRVDAELLTERKVDCQLEEGKCFGSMGSPRKGRGSKTAQKQRDLDSPSTSHVTPHKALNNTTAF